MGTPVEASSAAMWFRVCPSIVVNPPPAYTVVPLTAKALTGSFASGNQGVASPVVASSAAMLLRNTVSGVLRVADRLKVLQAGSLHAYLAYVIVLVLSLVLIIWWRG